ncbi:MAG: hypothetical protein HDT43_11025 [Ruminococcaceae bacterium]|nr:hypothetical protein [Oscillospiraceae bacterium]
MKKIIIPIVIAIAAVLGVVGGIAAVTVYSANLDTGINSLVSNDILKSGKYYLNGDVNAEMWFEVNPDFLTLKGNDIDKSLTEFVLSHHADTVADEVVSSELETLKQLYCAEKLYQLTYIGIEDRMPYAIYVDRDNTITDREELVDYGKAAAFRFNDQTNTIGNYIGEFTLVE